jgi:regulator of sigma E protease
MLIAENVLWLLVLIGVMILIHELGHYWAARFFDVRVETFSFGFGPRLFGFRKGETDFRFSAILFGGYVKMAGEQAGEEGADDPRGFLARPRWQRLIIAFSGPAMNIVLAVALLTGLFMVKFPKPATADGPATIGHVTPDTPADKAGLKEGDIIVRVDGKPDPTWEDLLIKEISGAGQPMALVVSRGGAQILTTLTPVLDARTGVGLAGWYAENEIQISALLPDMDAERKGLRRGDVLLSINSQPIRSNHKLHEVIRSSGGKEVEILYSRDGVRNKVMVKPVLTNLDGTERYMIGVQLEPRVVIVRLPFSEALTESVRQNTRGATLIYQFLKGIIERRMSPKSLEGPIRIAQLSGDAAREGPGAFISLMAMVSLNLAVFNMLPIPILDGGVILLLLVEMIMRRDLSLAVKEAVFKLGFVFLMAVVAFVLYNDLSKILPPG